MFVRTFGRCALLVVALLMMSAEMLSAATIARWRFEDTPGFLLDSSGNGNTLSVNGTVTQATLPGVGPGSAFPTIIPNTLQTNAKAADIDGTTDNLQRNVISSLPTTQFTIESFVHWATSANNNEAGASGDGIFALRDGAGNPSIFFQIRTDGLSASDLNGELGITVGTTAGAPTFLKSGFKPTQGKDYYMAATYDVGSNIKFYVKNLTDNTALQTFNVSHSKTGILLPAATTAEIGGFTNITQFDFDGLIDEVRFSNVALGIPNLLITDLPPVPPVPEPATFWMLGLGVVALRGCRRNRTIAVK